MQTQAQMERFQFAYKASWKCRAILRAIMTGLCAAAALSAQLVLDEGSHLTVKANGFVQARYTAVDPTAADSSETFGIPLARFALSGSAFSPNLSYFFQIQDTTNGTSNKVTMLDAWVGYRFSEQASVQAGRMLLPYSRQFYTHPGNLLFADLSLADYAFNLPRAVAVGASGGSGRVLYYGAVMNSVQALDAAGPQQANGKVGFLGRIEVNVLAPYGYLESAPQPVTRPQFSIGLAAALNPVEQASVMQNATPGERTRNFTVDSGFRWRRVTLQSALYTRHDRVSNSARPALWDWGVYGQAGIYVVPRRLELAGRISTINFGAANDPEAINRGSEDSLGVNYYIHGHNIKVQTDYSLVHQQPFLGEARNDHRVRTQLQLLF
jgi:hypothetical protein